MSKNDDKKKSIIKLFHDGKAGLEGLDAEKINEIINDTTRGSNFYNHKLNKQKKVDEKVKLMLKKIESSTTVEKINAKKNVESLIEEYVKISKDLSHIIVHLDMDMFFAAVEMRDNPELVNKPIAVGSDSMLSTSNYEARKFGVRAAMPGFIAKKLCPELIIISGGFNKYKEESKRIANVVKEFDQSFVPGSLDECFLDLTTYISMKCSEPNSQFKIEVKENSDGVLYLEDDIWNFAATVVEEIRKKIFDVTQLTCSAGIAPNKLLAKICSDLNKPNNQYLFKAICLEDLKNFIHKFNVKKIPGVGPVQQQTLMGLKIETVKQLYENLNDLYLVYTQSQLEFFVRISLGISSYEIINDESSKSESREETFKPTNEINFLLEILNDLCIELSESLKKHECSGKTITLKLKKETFTTSVKSKTINEYTNDSAKIFEVGKELLLKELKNQNFKLRLIGIRVSNFINEEELIELNQQTKINDIFKKKLKEINCNNESKATCSNDLINEINQKNSHDLNSKNCVNISIEKNELLHYNCPICNKSFCDLTLLNQHVDYCLSKETILNTIEEVSKSINNDTKINLNKKRKNSNEIKATKKNTNEFQKSKKNELQKSKSPKKINEYFKSLNKS